MAHDYPFGAPDLTGPIGAHITFLDNAIVVPPAKGLGNQSVQKSGVLTADGEIVENAVTWRGPNPVTIRPVMPPADQIIDLPGTYMFLGPLFGHFGHFLVESGAVVPIRKTSKIHRIQDHWSGSIMTIRVAINGYGRIGRNILRAHYEGGKKHDIQIVAINDLGDANINAHLTKYDTAHGKFPGTVAVEGDSLVINGDRIKVCAQRNPAELPWKALNVDVVLECTGLFTSKAKAGAHLTAGAKKVIISAPGDKDVDATVVQGVNHGILKASHTVISNASCTTNCLAPLVKALHDRIGVVSGLMTTIHSYTNDQVLTDVYHTDLRRARSATMSMIPTKTGAAAAVGLVLPELNGKLDGYAMRVPTINVSIVDLCFVARRATSVEEVNNSVRQAAETDLKGILEYSKDQLVSIDFNHNPASSIFDSTLTKVSDGTLVKVCSWYDNEWGFSNRMLDTTVALVNAK